MSKADGSVITASAGMPRIPMPIDLMDKGSAFIAVGPSLTDGTPLMIFGAPVGTLEGMIQRDVRDLVTDNGSQLILVFRYFEYTAENTDLAAGHREGIDVFILEYFHFPLVTRVGFFELGDDRIRHATHVGLVTQAVGKGHLGAHLLKLVCSLHLDLRRADAGA